MHLTRHRIEALIRESFDGFEMAASNPGPLVPEGCSGGFNPIRWKFWGQRLEELKRSNNEDVSESAEAVLTWWRLIDSYTLGGDDPDEEVKPGRFWASGQLK